MVKPNFKPNTLWTGDDLRQKEPAKLTCGEAHFKALANQENPAKFVQSTDVDDLLKEIHN